jgi:hypothetical protein
MHFYRPAEVRKIIVERILLLAVAKQRQREDGEEVETNSRKTTFKKAK